MPFEDNDVTNMLYSRTAQIVRYLARVGNTFTANNRRVKAEVIVDRNPPPERQHIDTKKWPYFVEISFDRQLPSISWRRTGDLNTVLLLTEENRLLFGVHFVVVNTDQPDRYDYHQLALAICRVFDWSLTDCTISRNDRLNE